MVIKHREEEKVSIKYEIYIVECEENFRFIGSRKFIEFVNLIKEKIWGNLRE